MATEIKYNGEVIASPEAGQTATLKCAGMKMESDVVVEVAEMPEGGGSNANIAPLIVGDVGTYDANSPVIVTETFTGEGEPDAVFDYWGIQIPYFKAKNLVATRDIFALANDETLADKLYVDLFGDVSPICQLEQFTTYSNTSLVVHIRDLPAILWVIATDERYFTQEAGFEDGGVYIADAWGFLGATGNASVSALGIPDKPTDGFMPVTVSLPIEDELVVNIKDYISYSSTINDGILYRKVKTNGMTPKYLTITPTNQEQIFSPESDTFFRKITVEPIDISDLSKQKVLCGIYLDPMPKTEYKVGEWLDESGSVMVRQYTNGETEHVSLTLDCVFGFGEIARVPGTHKLTVKVTEGGITSQTVFWVTITE